MGIFLAVAVANGNANFCIMHFHQQLGGRAFLGGAIDAVEGAPHTYDKTTMPT